MTINSRAKGQRGERSFAAALRNCGYANARRGQQFKGGADSPDVVGLPGVHIEVKFTERLQLYEAYGQSMRDSGEGEIPIVAHRKNHRNWVVILSLNDFLKLYGAWSKTKGENDEH